MRPQDAARAVLNGTWDTSLPVNPVAIANKLGLKVFFSEELHDKSGEYVEEERAINIRKDESSTRQRFSIAHEIGHAVLGHGSSNRRSTPYSIYNYEPVEVAANAFAAELLMPREAVSVMVESRNMLLDDLCKKFDVSQQAMQIRLRELGYI